MHHYTVVASALIFTNDPRKVNIKQIQVGPIRAHCETPEVKLFKISESDKSLSI